ncbi:MAG: uracil-DNA glycosylase [bacterium]|nr:uracil-DNA glycosylase [bacterium]
MDKVLNSLINALQFEKKHFRKYIAVTEELEKEDTLLESDIMNCRKCSLYSTAVNKVIGSGNLSANIMLVGEAPGEEEDKRGVPFVGRAGEKLEEMLKYIGLSKNDVYICNVLKCRPPHNADPTREQEESCIVFLKRQIKLVKPKVILTLGRHAASAVLDKESKNMYEYLNKVFEIDGGIKVISTYHPAAILYSKGEAKNKIRIQVASDLVKLKGIAGEL